MRDENVNKGRDGLWSHVTACARLSSQRLYDSGIKANDGLFGTLSITVASLDGDYRRSGDR